MLRYLIITLILLNTSAAWSDTLHGKIVGVSDGDSVTVIDGDLTQHKIRLAGIDAPEQGQPFGQASKRSLSELVFNKIVTIDWSKKDRYGRIVGKVLVNGLDANLEQVKLGLAWFYKEYQNELNLDDRLAYLDAHEEAMTAKKGLWIEPTPIAPWDWRKAVR
jgi:endonuclease YncB( thermonuclease family)